MGELVGGEQREQLENIEDNIREAHNNVVEANEELD